MNIHVKKNRRAPILIGFIIILIPMVLGAIFMYEMTMKKTPIMSSESPNATYELEIMEIGEPKQLGPSKIRIVSNDDRIEVALENDGEIPDENNFTVHWESETEAIITMIDINKEATTVQFNAKAEEIFVEK